VSLLLRNALVGGARTSVLVDGSTIAAVGDALQADERTICDGRQAFGR